MKRFTVMVSRAPYDSRNAENALKFCHAALSSGHSVDQVFFYQSGVHCASNFLEPPSDEINIFKEWVALHQQYKVKLNVCNTAASRRGVIDNTTSNQTSSQHNVNAPFVMTGLSDYFTALSTGSINVQF